jgi:hypothetical protein
LAQKLGHGSDTDVTPWRIFLVLGLCLAVAVTGAFALRWRMQNGTTLPTIMQRRMRLVERLRLSHQVDLCLVQCDGREFLIATSPRDTCFGPGIFPIAIPDNPATDARRS